MSNELAYNFHHEGTDQLSQKDIDKITSNLYKLKCYQNNEYKARKPLPLKAFKVMIQLMFDAGLRVNEAIHIKVNDINFSYGIIKVTHAKGGWKTCKNAKAPQIPEEVRKYIDTKAMKIKKVCDSNCKICSGHGKIRKPEFTACGSKTLEKIAKLVEEEELKGNDYLFKSPSFNHPIRRDWVWKRCKEIDQLLDIHYFDMLENSGRVIEGLTTHAFRKSLTKDLIDKLQDNKANIRLVIKQLRHKSLKPLQTYMDPSLEKLVKARQSDKFALS